MGTMTSSAKTEVAIAEALTAARRCQQRVRWRDVCVPASYAEAMAAQADIARRLNAEVGAWKVGVRPDGMAVAAPIYADLIYAADSQIALGAHRSLGIEAEIAFRLGRDLPPAGGRPYARADVLAAVDAVLVGIEIVRGRFEDDDALPYPAFLADNLGNDGYVVGASISDVSVEISTLRCRVSIDGTIVHEAVGGHPLGDPLLPLVAYASMPIDQLGGLRAGQIVTTGSLCGIITLDHPAAVRAEIERIGAVSFEAVS
jgi:2-keto-4-pentenoate hydratase